MLSAHSLYLHTEATNMRQTLTIAVDFDGTIVEHAYPKIGKPILFAVETLKALQKRNHRLVLWTIREGRYLEEAIAYCEKQGLTFYAVNEAFPGEGFEEGQSRKVNVDLFIDDRNVGGLLPWGEIWKMIEGDEMEMAKEASKKGFLQRLFGS